MKKFDNISIKWKVFSQLIIFIAIPIALLWLFQIAFMEPFYTMIKVRDIEESVDTITENIDNEDLSVLIERIARQEGVEVQIYSREGEALYEPLSGMPGMGNGMRWFYIPPGEITEYFERAEEHGGTYTETTDNQPPAEFLEEMFEGNVPALDNRGGKNIFYSKIVSSDGGDVLLVLNATITPVTATVRTLQVQLVFVTVILLALCLILAFIMSKRIAQPIVKTTASAKELAKGEYDTAFDARGYREITELNETLSYAATELSKVEKLRQELIANVSHDLRTPLTMITGYAEVMRDIPGENKPENVQIIIDEAKRLSELVSDVMDLSQVQVGTGELQLSTFNLTQCIYNIMKRYAKLKEQDGFTIRFIDGEDAYVQADELRISQVVYNLINNAVNYTGKDKTVTVCQNIQNGTVRVEVIDTGSGIAKGDLPYIWDRYYKVDKTHRRATVGTGLGLSIVRAILKKHDAPYGVISKEGEGSVFWFELKTVPKPDNGVS